MPRSRVGPRRWPRTRPPPGTPAGSEVPGRSRCAGPRNSGRRTVRRGRRPGLRPGSTGPGGTRAKTVLRTRRSVHPESRITRHALWSRSAAASRSLSERRRRCWPARSTRASIVVTNRSNRSRTSSRAVTSWTLAKARRVAWRRGGDILAMACARAAAAYRARARTRTGGTAESLMEPIPRISDLVETLQGLDQAGDADPSWGAAEPFQGRLVRGFVGDQQRLQTGGLLGFQGPCQGAPQPRGGRITNLGDQAGQYRDSRQQHLAFDQPDRGQVEEDAGSFGTDPGPVGDPA